VTLPANYAWLETIAQPPRMIVEGLKLYGLKETPGPGDNPAILAMAREVHLDGVYKHDEIAWCGLTMAVIAQRAGKPIPEGPLYALNWRAFGVAAPVPGLGDVLMFYRRDGAGKLIGGHVGLYVAEDADAFHVLAGNQGDQVSIARIAKTRLAAARRPIWQTAQPASVRPYIMRMDGTLSTNEG
jgi:uncharacterized protein (TIGR02594 family)